MGNWVHHNRIQYQLLKKGRKSQITTEKALKLAEVGFEFTLTCGKSNSSHRELYDPHPHFTRTSDDNDMSMNDEEEEYSEDDLDDAEL